MIISKKEIKKIRKNKEKLRQFVSNLFRYNGDDEHDYEVRIFNNYINDFYYLALKNNWEWYDKEITLITIKEQVIDFIVYLLSHKKVDYISSGRIGVMKDDLGDDYEISLKIDY
jgi:hypothetical protein